MKVDGNAVRRGCAPGRARRLRRRGAGAGALLLAGVCAGVLPAGAASTSPVLTKPVSATKSDTDPTRTYTSPSVAIDPENDNIIVMGYVEARSRRCGLLRSMDAGQTWTKLDASP